MKGGASGRRPIAAGIHTTCPGSQGWRGPKARAILGHCGAFMALVLWSLQAGAVPYVPTEDSVVLERVTARGTLDRLEPLRRAVAANPRNLPATLELARAYLQLGRAAGDPRFSLGCSTATLGSQYSCFRPPRSRTSISAQRRCHYSIVPCDLIRTIRKFG